MSDCPGDDYKLPCDVHLPPNTYIRKGCSISTLLTALRVREAWAAEDATFPRPDRGSPPPARPKIDVREFVASLLADGADRMMDDEDFADAIQVDLDRMEASSLTPCEDMK